MPLELSIEKLAYGGEGLARAGGKVYFVDNALPGEKVLAEVTSDKKSFARATVVKTLQASPHRLTPPCRYVSECGGCQYQHVTYEEEVRWKEIQVREHLERNLKLDGRLVHPIVASKNPYGYRTSLTVHPTSEGTTGFFAKDNTSVLPIDECLLVNPALNACFKNKIAGDATFRISETGKLVSNSESTFFEMKLDEEKITTHAKCFFQNNLEITAAIADQVRAWFQTSTFIDLYAGVGTFALLAGRKAKTLICLEENSFAVEALKKNLGNAAVLEGQAEKVFPRWWQENSLKDAFLFLDPPRKGLDSRFASFLATGDFSNLVYLSCHLGTLTRDLKILTGAGRFKIASVIPFDMFPRTKHIEALTLLRQIK